jgi:hypothetical protein
VNIDVENAASFLAGSILFSIALVVFIIGCVVVNNIIHKYWKPVKIFTPDSWKGFFPPQYSMQPYTEPEMDKTKPAKEAK